MGPSLSYIKPYRAKAILAPCMKAFEVVFELMTPFLVAYIIDYGIALGDAALAYTLAGVILIFAVLGFLTTMVTQYLASRVSADFGYDLRRGLYKKTEELSEGDLDRYGKGKIINLFGSDAQNLQSGVAMYMRLFVRSPLIILGSLILSFYINWQSGLIFLAALGLSSIVILLVLHHSPRRYVRIQNSLDQMAVVSGDALTGIRSVYAYGKVKEEEKKYDEVASEYKKKSISLGNINALVNPLTFAFVYLALAFIVYLGGFYSTGEDAIMTTGNIVSLVGYLTSSLASLTMFARLIESLNKAGGSKRRLDAFLSLKPSYVHEGTGTGEEHGTLEVDNLAFTYGGENALEGISFNLKQGDRLGIIGGTGSGKSTLANLLARSLETNEGEIRLGGVSLKDYGEETLRKDVTLITQKPAIFRGTIRQNLAYGHPDAGDEEMIEALKKSLAYEFVSEFEDDLDHVVTEGGTDLSGGQRQRLSLARAFLGRPKVIILDDCLSALDYLSEKTVRENLDSLVDSSIITISQRTSSLVNCDEILVLDHGRIIGRGKHGDLMKTCPLYAEIDKTQKEAS